jgi:hypothetical protein
MPLMLATSVMFATPERFCTASKTDSLLEQAYSENSRKNPKNSLNIITLMIKNSLKRGNIFVVLKT